MLSASGRNVLRSILSAVIGCKLTQDQLKSLNLWALFILSEVIGPHEKFARTCVIASYPSINHRDSNETY